MIGAMMIAGGVLALVLGTLSHPKFYAAVFHTRRRSADHSWKESF